VSLPDCSGLASVSPLPALRVLLRPHLLLSTRDFLTPRSTITSLPLSWGFLRTFPPIRNTPSPLGPDYGWMSLRAPILFVDCRVFLIGFPLPCLPFRLVLFFLYHSPRAPSCSSFYLRMCPFRDLLPLLFLTFVCRLLLSRQN